MLKSAERIEFLYGHFFDETIVNEDLETAFEELSEAVSRAENESLW
jgi:guanylate kinase